MRGAAAALLLLAACSDAAPTGPEPAGPMLEKAAIARGLVRDPEAATLTGLFARGAARLCIIAEKAGEGRIGVTLNHDADNGCSAAGRVSRAGNRLRIDFGQGCAITADHDGRTIRFPGATPAECAKLCRGNAALAGLTVERLSDSPGEAAALSDRRGRVLCGDEGAKS